jgi:hypothetical protein
MLKDVVPRACSVAKLAKRITTHGLPHTFASHLVMRGASLKAVQELLGHESIEMTLRYSHLTPDVKREAVQLLDWTETAHPSTPGPLSRALRSGRTEEGTDRTETEISGDIRETAEAEKENPRGHRGLS